MIRIMREVNLAGLDLNLLPPLEALLRRRNVTHAAADVGLSQPAMSRALSRLRDVLGDPLLVRAGGSLVLTPRAQTLAAQIAPALERIKGVFREEAFDPRAAQRAIRIAGADTHAILIAPGILKRFAAEAPGLDLRIEPYGRDIVGRMESGALDFAFALTSTQLPPGARSERCGEDRLALVMRRGHPAAKKRWTVADYARVEHAAVAIFGDGQSDLDALLAAEGVRRRIAFTSPHFIATLAAVGASDCVTTLSRAFAARFADTFDLVLKEPPFATAALEQTLVWSDLYDSDPLLRWARGIIRDAATEAFAR